MNSDTVVRLLRPLGHRGSKIYLGKTYLNNKLEVIQKDHMVNMIKNMIKILITAK